MEAMYQGTTVVQQTSYEIAVEVAESYKALTGDDPELVSLLREAIMQGIRGKLETTGPLSQREIDELGFALYYVRRSHGTDGHHRLCLLAKFASLLGITLEGKTVLKGTEAYV